MLPSDCPFASMHWLIDAFYFIPNKPELPFLTIKSTNDHFLAMGRSVSREGKKYMYEGRERK